MSPFQKIVQTLAKHSKVNSKVICSFGLGLLIAVSLFGSMSPMAFATRPSVSMQQANVVIDGRPVFQLQSSGEFTARKRAKEVNHQLAKLAKLKREVEVEVVERDQQTTIAVDKQHLLTITNADRALEQTSVEQAQSWADQLGASLRQARVERQPKYQQKAAWLAGFALLTGIILHWLSGYFWQHSLKRMLRQAVSSILKKETPESQGFDFLMKLLLLLVRLLIWLSTLWYISSLFPLLRQQRYDIINNLIAGIQAPLFSLGGQPYDIADVLVLLGLFWGLFNLVQASARVLQNQVLQRTHLARGPREVFTQAYRYGAFVVGTLILLQAWGINLNSITLLGSALGIGIGFGFQDIAKNFGSGLVLLFERSIQVGDFIEIDSHMGIVERIGARSITILNLDNISILVPNAHLIDSRVVNWNHGHPISRLHLTIGIDYGADLKAVKSALLQAAEEHTTVLKKPSPDVYLKEFGDSAIEFDLMVWIRNPELQFVVRSDLYFRIEEILKENGISIPYPQHDLHLRSGTLPIEFSPDVTEALLKAFKETKGQITKEAEES